MSEPTVDDRERERVRVLMEQPHAVFVFGSNRAGVHGGGAARFAHQHYGAEWGVGEGLTGRTYALPTMDTHLDALTIEGVAQNVTRFLALATLRPDLVFAVTRVGCGIAGHSEGDIAPLFRDAPSNCELPEGWR